MQADVSDPVSVGAFIEAAACHSPNLLGLVNNAGIQGPKGRLEDLDPQEWIRTIEINLLGTMLCCRAVLPALRRANYGKIVNLSGGGATGPRPRMSAYACSKTAVIRLTETLAVEYAAHNINVNAIAPGALNTRMLDEVLKDGPAKVGEAEYAKAVEQKHQGGASVDRAAELCVFLLSKQSDRITGRLISAAWDPWESLPLHWHELEQSEAYTLRRVIPGDLRSEAEKLKEKQALDINSVQRPPHTSLNRAT
jgi:NAD(P)-dependent dehydrogenase (short-subunit alcohol dehydrogenase family)